MASPTTEIAAVRMHLVQAFGPPLEVLELSGSPDKRLAKLEIATWAPAGPTGPLILVTCGISRLALPDGRRLEALMMTRPVPPKDELNALVKLLGRFGLLVANATGSIAPGTVIRAPEEMAPVSTMPNLVLLPAITFPPQFRQLKRSDQQLVDLVWLSPVHEVEAQLVEAQGGEALVMQFSAYGIDLAGWRRDAIPKALTLEEAKAMLIAKSAAPPDPAESAKTKAEKVAQLKATAVQRAARVASQAGGAPPPGAPTPPPQHALPPVKPRPLVPPAKPVRPPIKK